MAGGECADAPHDESRGGGAEAKGSDAVVEEARVNLLKDDGDITKAFKLVLVKIFAKFDRDGDNLLNEAELKAYSVAANENEREFDPEELEEIREFFDTKDGPNGWGMTLRGWIQMYQTQTQGEEEETWRDLETLGYNGQLKLNSKPKLRAEGALRAKLGELVALGEAGRLSDFVAAFVASDVDDDDKKAFMETLSGENKEDTTGADDVGQLLGLLAELKCCLSGDGMSKIEGCQREGPVTFSFRSPAPGMDHVDREVVFVREKDGRWCAEG